MKKKLFLAADIGGTKSVLNVFTLEKKVRKIFPHQWFSNREFSSIEELLESYLSSIQYDIKFAVLGVAGPVINGNVKISNLPWSLNEKKLCRRFNFSAVKLINDLEATGWSLPILSTQDIFTLNKGKPQKNGNKAIIAPGTGLGEVFLSWDGSIYRPHPSEGGHADFAPITQIEIELLKCLQNSYDHVSYERVCSGPGIVEIFNFLIESQDFPESDLFTKKVKASNHPAAIIIDSVLNGTHNCPICKKTIDIFTSILGSETGNLALRTLARGGVYIGGGLSSRLSSFLNCETFIRAYQRKGRMQSLLINIPVYLIKNIDAPLLGAAQYAYQYFFINYGMEACTS